MLNFERFVCNTDDPDVLFRMIERNLDLVITYIATDGKTMDDDVLYEIHKIAQMDDQLFVLVNRPLVEAELATAMIEHPEQDCNNSREDRLNLFILRTSTCEISRLCRERYGDETP
jgi:hypothetical protein